MVLNLACTQNLGSTLFEILARRVCYVWRSWYGLIVYIPLGMRSMIPLRISTASVYRPDHDCRVIILYSLTVSMITWNEFVSRSVRNVEYRVHSLHVHSYMVINTPSSHGAEFLCHGDLAASTQIFGPEIGQMTVLQIWTDNLVQCASFSCICNRKSCGQYYVTRAHALGFSCSDSNLSMRSTAMFAALDMGSTSCICRLDPGFAVRGYYMTTFGA